MDSFRIESSIATLYNIIERGGRPIIMTHVNRPRTIDKKKKKSKIEIDEDLDSTKVIAKYLTKKLGCVFACPSFDYKKKYSKNGADDEDEGKKEREDDDVGDDDGGIREIDENVMKQMIEDLRERRIGGIYMPNMRWFSGEERVNEPVGGKLARELAKYADVFVNDAFGSWQPHVSTKTIAELLPSCAGLLLQRELDAMRRVLEPKRPFVAIVAGSKVNTKIGTLINVAKKCDALILGGVIYNAYLSAKYGVKIKGVDDEDVLLAKKYLIDEEEVQKKLLELPTLVESELLDGCGCIPENGKCTTTTTNNNNNNNNNDDGGVKLVHVKDMKAGNSYGYINDVAKVSYTDARIVEAIKSAQTILVNAVMGYTSKGFHEGTIGLDELIFKNNEHADIFFGGGDTLQEFKSLSPASYLSAMENPRAYLFTGGGTVLKVIEEGEVGKLEIVRVLTEPRAIDLLTDEDLYSDDGDANLREIDTAIVPNNENDRSRASLKIKNVNAPGCVDFKNCDCSDLNDSYPEQIV
jgi:phosphoglycerate kinase